MTFPDDSTLIFQWPGANGLFLSHLAGPEGLDLTSYPAHWCRQFHASYTADEQDGKWTNSFWEQMGYGQVPGRPVLSAWMPVDPYVGGASQVTFARNPYYWKVDSAGQQLPYIDRVAFTVLDSVDAMVTLALNGEIDMQERFIASDINKPVFIDHRESGDYRLYTVYNVSMNRMAIMFNLTHPDPVKREIFNNQDFRIGLSHAINRQEIIDTIYVGVGQPWQNAPLPSSPLYNADMAQQYTEYSLEKANTTLDQAGYLKDASGRRRGPDGKPISFVIEVVNTNPDWIDMLNMVVDDWAEFGIHAMVTVDERMLHHVRSGELKLDATGWAYQGSLADVLLDPASFVPYGGSY